MGMHKSGRNDTVNPGASCDNKGTLREYIAQKEAQVHRELQASLTEYERGYQDGWYDAHVRIKGDK